MNFAKISKIIDNAAYFSGTCQITKNNSIKLYAAKGYAKKEDEIPNKLSTSFGIASGTKGFTALGILKLIDVGKLSLDDDVFKILPYSFPKVRDKITLRHLLCHTSGIYDYFDEDVTEDFAQIFEKVSIQKIFGPKDLLPLLNEGESYFKPGEKFKYCNSGFVILGLLIESISGMTYSDYLHNHVIKPLGLERTGCYRTNQLPKNSAVGYIKDEEGAWKSNIFEVPLACTADGGLFTTADDIRRMWSGFLFNEFLCDDIKCQALKIHSHIKENKYYGLGFYIDCDNNGNIINYHLVGGDPGVGFCSYYFIDKDIIITILSNTSDGAWKLLKETEGLFY